MLTFNIIGYSLEDKKDAIKSKFTGVDVSVSIDELHDLLETPKTTL